MSLKEKLHWRNVPNDLWDATFRECLTPVHFVNKKCGYYTYGFINLDKEKFDEDIKTLENMNDILVNHDTVNIHIHRDDKLYVTTHCNGPFSLKNVFEHIRTNAQITLQYLSVCNLMCFYNTNIKMKGSNIFVFP